MKVRLISGAIVLAFLLAALAASEHAKPNDDLPLVSADWPGIRDDARVVISPCNPVLQYQRIGPVQHNKGVHQV